jgi:hypothetical protein
MSLHTKVSGVWKEITTGNIFVKDSGVWKDVANIFVNVSGTWTSMIFTRMLGRWWFWRFRLVWCGISTSIK